MWKVVIINYQKKTTKFMLLIILSLMLEAINLLSASDFVNFQALI